MPHPFLSYLVLQEPSPSFSAIYHILLQLKSPLCIFYCFILVYLCYFKVVSLLLSSTHAFFVIPLGMLKEPGLNSFLFPQIHHRCYYGNEILAYSKHIQQFGLLRGEFFWHRIYPITAKWTWRLVITTNNPTLGGHLHPMRPVFLGNGK